MERTIPIPGNKYYKAMLTIVSSLIPGGLTSFEVHILATMLINDIRSINKITRLDLRLLLDTSEYNLNNYIKKLKAKKVLLQTEDGLELNQTIKEAVRISQLLLNLTLTKMPITMSTATIQLEDYLELEEVHGSMEDKMNIYAKGHKDFSVLFEKHLDDNTLVIKTLYLEEHVN